MILSREAPLRCELDVVRGTPHTQQIVAGFLMLARQGYLDLRIRLERPGAHTWPFIVSAALNRRVNIGYDLQDGVITLGLAERRYLDSRDHFFVRSYRRGAYGEHEPRVHPLGLNYDVTILHPTALRARYASLAAAARALAKQALGRESLPLMSVFEHPPSDGGDGRVLFMTRVWSPQEIGGHVDFDAVDRLNQERAGYVRALRDALGERFVGGLHPSSYATASYPDCVLDRRLTQKRRYLLLMRGASVCITSPGISRSNGWRLAEFVAASKAIVAPALYFEVPGGFEAGVNFLPASSGAEAASAAATLLADEALRAQMAVANWGYYRRAVRPDAIVARSLERALQSD